MNSSMTHLGDELLFLLQSNESGLSDEQISHHFGDRYPQLVPIINDLLGVNRLQLFHQGKSLVYKIVHAETAAKFDGLGYINTFYLLELNLLLYEVLFEQARANSCVQCL